MGATSWGRGEISPVPKQFVVSDKKRESEREREEESSIVWLLLSPLVLLHMPHSNSSIKADLNVAALAFIFLLLKKKKKKNKSCILLVNFT